MIFATKKELIEWFNSNENYSATSNGNYYPTGTYYLSHGEYSQPEFKPTRYKDGWSVKGIYFYHSNTFNAPKDGRVNDDFYTNH